MPTILSMRGIQEQWAGAPDTHEQLELKCEMYVHETGNMELRSLLHRVNTSVCWVSLITGLYGSMEWNRQNGLRNFYEQEMAPFHTAYSST